MEYTQSRSYLMKIQTSDSNILNAWNLLVDMLTLGEIGHSPIGQYVGLPVWLDELGLGLWGRDGGQHRDEGRDKSRRVVDVVLVVAPVGDVNTEGRRERHLVSKERKERKERKAGDVIICKITTPSTMWRIQISIFSNLSVKSIGCTV